MPSNIIRRISAASVLCALTLSLLSPLGVSAAPPSPAQLAAATAGVQPPVVPGVFRGDVRDLPFVPQGTQRHGRPREAPISKRQPPARPAAVEAPAAPAAMPALSASFDGLAFSDACTGGNCGNGWPPDPAGDVGPNHYVEAVNTSVGIFSKTGTRLAALTFNSLWSAANTGTACDNAHDGDVTVIYDQLADRWILGDFAFVDQNNPPYYECVAVSRSGDPVAGGWYFYPILANDYFPDYPKMGLWPDGIYMSANMFNGNTYVGARVWAFNRADLENGAPLRQVVSNTGASYFTLLPANLRGDLPPAGTPEYFAGESLTIYGIDVFKFSVDWSNMAASTFGSNTTVSHDSYSIPYGPPPTYTPNIVPQPGTTTALDSLGDRLIMQAQYRNIGGAESLWVVHTTRASTNGRTQIQWLQLSVTGGTIAATPAQQQIYGDTPLYRWMPSLAVDHAGNMAVGFSTSNGTAPNYPSISYAGRLATDPASTLGQGEAQLFAGTASQIVTCGGTACHRWGDYSAMTVDPVDDCTFWYVNEYYASGDTQHWRTRIGAFAFPSCTAAPVQPLGIWDGGGANNNGGTPANWTRNTLPGPMDNVIFNTTSTKDSSLDANLAVASWTITSGYTGTISQGTSNITVTNAFSQTGGAYNGGSGTLAVQRDFTHNGGTFASQTGTVSFNGTGTQNITGDTAFQNVRVGSGVTVTTPSTLTVGGLLTNLGWTRETRAIGSTGNQAFGLAGVTAAVVGQGTLASLAVTRRDQNDPNAGPPEQTGKYWQFQPTGTGYTVTLALPHAALADPSACRYTGSNWDCARSAFDSTTVTRTNVTAFSDWAVGDAAVAPAVAPTVEITSTENGAALGWAPIPADNAGYQAWWSGGPYFNPGDPGSNFAVIPVGGSSYTYTAASGAPAYFVVLGVNSVTVRSPNSNRTGKFEFDLVPGTP